MADENISIAVTDDGTIDEVVALLQLLGLTGEEAAARAASGFVNLSQSQQVAANSARIMGAAANAQFQSVNNLRDATDQLTTSEQKAAATVDGAAKLTLLLAEAQKNGYAAALQLKDALESQAASSARSSEALTAQGEAVEGLSRLQQNLIAREQELTNAFLLTISTSNSYTTSQNNMRAAISATNVVVSDALTALNAYERAQVQLGISVQGLYGVYTAQDTLFGAQAAEAAGAARELAALGTAATATAGTFAALDRAQAAAAVSAEADATSFAAVVAAAEQRLAATTQLAAGEAALVSADERASAAVTEFIALQRECNTTTIAGRDAIASATVAYHTAVDAVGALAVEQEIAASNMGKSADAALKMADGLRAASAAAVNLEAAEDVAAKEALTLTGAMERVSVVGKELNGSIGGLNALFASAFAVTEIVKFSDTATKLNVTLQTVTHSSDELHSVLGQLYTVANETQTSIDANVKTFVQLADSTKGTGVSTAQLIQATQGLDSALKIANVTGQDAYRVQRTIQEALSTTSGSAERFFQNLKRESPAAFALFTKAADDAGVSMKQFGGEQDKTSEKLYNLNNTLRKQQDALDGHRKSADADANIMRESQKAYNAASVASDAYSSIINKGGKLTDEQKAKNDKLNDTMSTQAARYNDAARAYGVAKDKQDQNTLSAIAHTRAQIDEINSTSDATKRTTDFVKILDQLATNNKDLASTFTTVQGSVEVLKNNMIAFVSTSGTANVSITVLKDAILLLASNLNIVVPAVILFGAAIAAVKIAETITKVVELSAGLIKLASSFVLANVPLIAFAAVVVGLVAVFQGLINLFLPAGEKLDTFGTLAKTAAAGLDLLGVVAGKASDQITKTAIHSANAADAAKAMSDAHGNAAQAAQLLQDKVTGADKAVVQFTVHNDAATLGLSQNSTTTSEASLAYVAAQKAISDASKALVDNATAAQADKLATDATAKSTQDFQQHVDTAKASQDALNDTIKAAPSLWEKLTTSIQDAFKALADYFNLSKSAGGDATPVSPTANHSVVGHARDGGTFSVPGSGPVDSKLIAVSPGEVVTVQTPAQYRAGVAPGFRAGQTHFATGGVSVGAGVTLGSSVSLSSSLPSVGSSVTGYDAGQSSAIGALTTAENANVSTTTANTAATASDTAATASNSDVVTANTTALASLTTSNAANTSATSTNSQSLTAAGNAAINAANATIGGLRDSSAVTKESAASIVAASNDNVKAANENTQGVAANTTALSDNSKNVISAANAIVTSNNALQTTLASAANAIVAAANTMAAAAKASSSTVTTSSTSPNTYTLSNDNTTTTTKLDPKNSTVGKYTQEQYEADAKAGTTSADGRTITGASGTIYQAVQSASGQIVGWKTSTGIDVTDRTSGGSSVSNTASDVISAQYKQQLTQMQNALNQTATNITNASQGYQQIRGTAYSMSSDGNVTLTSSLEADKQVAAQLTSEASAIHARDGADFYVPGGTGVDSQAIQLAVSPGEQVTVKTPAQQTSNESAPAGGVVNFYVTTPDAQSFGSSQPQIEAKLVRGLKRASRR